jgi:TonB family protein
MHFSPEQLAGLPESRDRRARVRHNLASLTCLEMGEGNGGIILNVSETGMAIAVAQSLVDDHVPYLSFRLPQLDRTFEAEGEIVWRSLSKKSAGVRFVNLEERDRMQIRNWIRAEIVAAELQTPQERGAAGPKPVLIMPSQRKAARQAERDAERNEVQAAEFDRMFPSEASLKAVEAPSEPEFNFLSANTADEDVELVAEAFRATQELDQPVVEAEASESEIEEVPSQQNVELGERKAATEEDWREKWERFHLERESLTRAGSLETMLDLPAPFSTPLPDSPAPLRDSLRIPAASERNSAAHMASVPLESSSPAEIVMPWSEFAPVVEGEEEIVAAPPDVTGGGQRSKNNPLSIAALCTVLVAMCFVLGYAIQPGAFRFLAGKFADAPEEGATLAMTEQAEEESKPASTVTMPAMGSALTGSPVRDAGNPPATAGAAHAEQKEKTAIATPKAFDAPDKHMAVHVNPPAAATSSPAEHTTAPPVKSAVQTGSDPGPSPATARVGQAEIQAPGLKAAIPSAGTTTPGTPASPAGRATGVPVSFFPVTAPSAGSPPKLLQLPEETISETPAIVIRSRQFLFVPAQPGLESEHALERVHLGDRILKVDPAYPAQAAEKFQGGTVHLRSTIGPDGAVSDVQPISGPTSLIPAAVSAVRQWRYKPTDIDGKPIAIEEDIVVEFRPSREIAAR